MDQPVVQAPARLRALPSWLINQAAIHASRLVSEQFAAVGLRRYHYSVLTALDENGPVSQAQLSRVTSIDRGDMVTAIDELAEHGWVTRRPDPSDRRRNEVVLTAAGRRQLRKLHEMVASIQGELVAPLSGAERKQFVRLLTAVVDHHRIRQSATTD